MSNRFVVHVVSVVLVVATVIVATGCAPKPPAEPLAVVWPGGEPEGVLESNEWVSAAREYSLAKARAFNLGDYSISLLADTATPKLAAELYKSRRLNVVLREQDGEVGAWSGPQPWAPMEVFVNDTDDAAVIQQCAFKEPAFFETKPELEVDLAGVPRIQYVMMRRGSDGLIRAGVGVNRAELPDIELAGGDWCDGSSIRIGYFDPLPEVPLKLTPDSVVPPLGVEKK